MNLTFSRAVDGEASVRDAMQELEEHDDPMARLDFLPALEKIA